MLAKLNETFGLKDAIRFAAGENSLPKAVLRHESGSELEVYTLGGHVTSWRTPELGEALYLSPKAEFQPGKAIRGGIPLIFPQFGPGPLPSHGFARNTDWLIHSTSRGQNGDTVLVLELNPTEQSKKIWGYRFRCELEIRLSAGLSTILRVENTGDAAISFQAAFHTYYGVSDIEKIRVSPFGGLTYLDNLKSRARDNEARDEIQIGEEVDRIYLKTAPQLKLDDPGLGRQILIKKQNLPDAVLWNPWSEKGASLKDLAAGDWRKFVCIEAGAIEPKVELEPGSAWEGAQEIWVLKRA